MYRAVLERLESLSPLDRWGNEFVKLQGNGLNIIKVKNGSKYVIIERFEIEGIAQDLNQSIVASQWWAESDHPNNVWRSLLAATSYITC